MFANFLKRKITFEIKRRLNSVADFKQLSAHSNTLIVHHRHELSDTQIYPFYYYHEALRKDHKIRFQEISLKALDNQNKAYKNHEIKRIYYQHGFMVPDTEIVKHLTLLSDCFPSAKIAFMDWFAPLHIDYANAADPFIDIYIKKQTYRNFDDYKKPTIGDTNLNDYYAKKYSIPDPARQIVPPAGFENKIRLWPNFYLSPQMVDLFLGKFPEGKERPIDLHARIATKGVPWYQAMRTEAKEAVSKLEGLRIASEGRVKRHKFFDELRQSKIVFSPFGYGEICWRDYEAFATGSLLLKPKIDHLVTFPDFFVENETYIPLEWDLSDLAEKIKENLHSDNRKTKYVFNEIQKSLKSTAIPDQVASTI